MEITSSGETKGEITLRPTREPAKTDILHAFVASLRLSLALGFHGLALAGCGAVAVLAWRLRRNKLKLRKEKSK